MLQKTTNIYYWISLIFLFAIELMISLIGALVINLPIIVFKRTMKSMQWFLQPLNDSGIHPDWGEGPESADELESSTSKHTGLMINQFFSN